MPELKIPTVINLLINGEMTIKGEFMWGSNYTFLVEIAYQDSEFSGVYKPNKGERPSSGGMVAANPIPGRPIRFRLRGLNRGCGEKEEANSGRLVCRRRRIV